MRIAIFSETYWPMVSGVATTLRRLVDAMHARGHQTRVYTASYELPEGMRDRERCSIGVSPDPLDLCFAQIPEPFFQPLNVSLDAPAAPLVRAPREEVPGIFPVVFGELSLQICDLLWGQAIEQIGNLPRAGAHRLQQKALSYLDEQWVLAFRRRGSDDKGCAGPPASLRASPGRRDGTRWCAPDAR